MNTLIEQAGRPTAAHLSYAARFLTSLPDSIRRAARETYSARALVYAMLIDRNAEVRERQLAIIDRFTDSAVSRETRKLLPEVEKLDRAARLPVIDLAIGALRRLTPIQYADFALNLDELIRADARINLFEWVIQHMVRRHLEPTFRGAGRRLIKHSHFGAVRREASVLLSALAYAGQPEVRGAEKAFAASAGMIEGVLLTPWEECRLERLDAAVTELAGLAPRLKKKLLSAAAAIVTADRLVTDREAELFRGIADALGIPVPPLLPGQSIA